MFTKTNNYQENFVGWFLELGYFPWLSQTFSLRLGSRTAWISSRIFSSRSLQYWQFSCREKYYFSPFSRIGKSSGKFPIHKSCHFVYSAFNKSFYEQLQDLMLIKFLLIGRVSWQKYFSWNYKLMQDKNWCEIKIDAR